MAPSYPQSFFSFSHLSLGLEEQTREARDRLAKDAQLKIKILELTDRDGFLSKEAMEELDARISVVRGLLGPENSNGAQVIALAYLWGSYAGHLSVFKQISGQMYI